MVPADEVSPKGTDLGVNIYIDRALVTPGVRANAFAGAVETRCTEPGLPVAAHALYRAGIAATNAHCRKTYGRSLEPYAPRTHVERIQ